MALAALAAAQVRPTTPDGAIVEVRVEGSEAYAEIVRTLLSVRPGTPVERIDLGAERDRVYGIGTFETVTVSIVDEPRGPVLVVRVVENPTIGDVSFRGLTALSSRTLLDVLASDHLVQVGRVFNASRANDAIETIQAAYRAAGFPFAPDVVLETERAPELADRGEEPPLRLRYEIDESASLDEVIVGPSSVLDEDRLDDLTRFLRDLDTFDLAVYQAAVRAIGAAYDAEGFRGSGIDTVATQLSGGVLDLRFRELRIAAIDTTPLGIDAGELSLGQGDLFDYDTLLTDVRRLATGRTGDVRLVPLVNAAGGVRVTFELGPPDTAGEIVEVVLEGVTVLDPASLADQLDLRVGDTFTSTLAREDFARIVAAYSEAGYLIVGQPDFNWIDGRYVQRVTEYRVAGYALEWSGATPSVEEWVVLREMPAVGSVLSLPAIDRALQAIAQQGAVRPTDRRVVAAPEGGPADVLVRISVEEAQTGLFQPAATYSTSDGFSASFTVSESNLLGRAHVAEASVEARTSDIGFLVGGSVRYTVPWLYVDALDFRDVRTSVSASVYSDIRSNLPMYDGAETTVVVPGSMGGEGNRGRIGEYTVRETGVASTIGRAVTPDLTVRGSVRAEWSDVAVEPPAVTCQVDGDGNVTNGGTCSLPFEEAVAYAPSAGFSSFFAAEAAYDARDSSAFPRSGVSARALVGIGAGNDFDVGGVRTPYTYVPVEVGARTYVTLASLAPAITDDEGHVFAVRMDVGTQIGDAFPASKRFSVGNTLDLAKQIRGYREDDFGLSTSYLTASFEYRYDFNFSTAATQTVIAIAFADVGWASDVPGYAPGDAPVFGSVGAGVQVNLGVSGVLLPALRFDYGFSERNPDGVFAFRIGTVF